MNDVEVVEEKGIYLPGDFIMIPWGLPIIEKSRQDFLNKLPVNSICAEIGVAQAGFSKKILEFTNPKIFYAVDPWDTLYTNGSGLEKAKKDREIAQRVLSQFNNVKIKIKTAKDCENVFLDEELDWLYLDANHSEKNVLEDLHSLYPKVKRNGILWGHDFCTTGDWNLGDFIFCLFWSHLLAVQQ